MGKVQRRYIGGLGHAAIAPIVIVLGIACSGGSGTTNGGAGRGGATGEGGGGAGSADGGNRGGGGISVAAGGSGAIGGAPGLGGGSGGGGAAALGGGSGGGGAKGLGGGGSGANGGGGGTPLSSFGQAYERAFCAPLVNCGVYPDATTCEAATPFAETSYILTAIGASQRGTIHYDPVAAAACIAGLPTDCPFLLDYSAEGERALAAYDLLSLVPACAGVFTGQLAQGASCQISAECGPNGYCNSPNLSTCTTNQCCPGTCLNYGAPPTPPLAVGADCSTNPRCQPPAVCDGTCIVPPAEGASCDPLANYPCGQLDDYCLLASTTATTGTCTNRGGVGKLCMAPADNGGCPLEAACVGSSTGAFTCVERGYVGVACAATPDGCLPSLTCTSSRVCGPVTAGMDCGPPP